VFSNDWYASGTYTKRDNIVKSSKTQVRIYLGEKALEAATHESKTTGKNFSQAVESLILCGLTTGEADNAKSENSLSS